MDPILEDITPQDLFEFARAVPVPENFLITKSLLPTRKIQGIRYRIKSRTKTVAAAQFRAWDTETPRGRRVVSRLATEGELPPLGTKFDIGEREQILINAQRFGDDAALIEELYDDVERAVLAIYGRLELAGGDMLDDGKFTLENENGITDEVDWQVPANHRPTQTTWWDNPNANPIEAELALVQLLTSKGKRPGRAVGSLRIASALGKSRAYRDDYFGGQFDPSATNAGPRNLTPGEVASVRASRGLPPLTEYDEMVPDAEGVLSRPIPDNRLLLLPAVSDNFAETQYGITAEMNTLVSGGQLEIEREEEPGIVVTKKVHDDPVSVSTRSNATAMPVMYDPEGYVTTKVLPDA